MDETRVVGFGAESGDDLTSLEFSGRLDYCGGHVDLDGYIFVVSVRES